MSQMTNLSWKPFIPTEQSYFKHNPYVYADLRHQPSASEVFHMNAIFEPKPPKFKVSRQEVESECDGVENLIEDMEVSGWVLGIVGFLKGLISLIGSTLSITFTKVNAYFVGLPSRILTILRDLGVTVPENIESVFSTLEIVFEAMELKFWIPFEQLTNFVHFMGLVFDVLSLGLGFLTLSSDIWKDDLELYVGRRAARFIRRYGCRD